MISINFWFGAMAIALGFHSEVIAAEKARRFEGEDFYCRFVDGKTVYEGWGRHLGLAVLASLRKCDAEIEKQTAAPSAIIDPTLPSQGSRNKRKESCLKMATNRKGAVAKGHTDGMECMAAPDGEGDVKAKFNDEGKPFGNIDGFRWLTSNRELYQEAENKGKYDESVGKVPPAEGQPETYYFGKGQ